MQQPIPVPRKDESNGALGAHMKVINMNHERNEMEG